MIPFSTDENDHVWTRGVADGVRIHRPDISRFTVPLNRESFDRFEAIVASRSAVELPEAGHGLWLIVSTDVRMDRNSFGRVIGGEIRVKAVATEQTREEVARASLDRENARRDATVAALPRELYEAYIASSGGLNYQGLPCPAWPDLTEAARQHWGAAAVRARVLLTGG